MEKIKGLPNFTQGPWRWDWCRLLDTTGRDAKRRKWERKKGKRKSLEMRKEKDKYIETSATQKTTGYLRFTHVGVCVCRVCRVITCWKRCVNERSSKAKKKHKKGSRKRVKLSGPSPAAKNLEPITPKNIVPPIVFSPPQKNAADMYVFPSFLSENFH